MAEIVEPQPCQGFLNSQVGRIYQNFDLTVTMGELRSIDIYVVGQAQQRDAVIVPEQTDKGSFVRGLKDWSTIPFNFGLAATAVKVLSP